MLYRSMKGKMVDMAKLTQQNELMPAIGNMKVNARGDELGAGGKIVRKREEIMAEYYEANPKSAMNRQPSKPVDPPAAVETTNSPPDKILATETRSNKKGDK